MVTAVKVKTMAQDEKIAGDEPVSPTGQYFNSSVLSVAILAVFEVEVPIDDSPAFSTLEDLFLPINPRFSSIMVRDDDGIQQWKKVKVNLQDHVHVPIFPVSDEGLYDSHVSNYISKIAMETLPQNRPLWDLHLIKYPTHAAAGTMVFKLHHALGDGYSLMGALFSCIRRADDPSLPLTFPSSSSRKKQGNEVTWWSIVTSVPRGVAVCINTVRDFGWSLLKSKMLEDDRSPVRSGEVGVEFRPITISTVAFSLDDIKQVKAKLGGTVNDVITGTIFYGIQLYVQAAGHASKSPALTALVLLNTRVIDNYQSIDEMNKPGAKSPWGNQFGFLHVSLPQLTNIEATDPLHFILRAKQIIQAKRTSLAVFLTGRLLETVRKLKGPEAAARYIHQTLSNTSMTISNLTGPQEQMIIAGHPIRSLYFMVVRVPQSLSISLMSYMGKLKVAMGTEKGFIDSELLVSCMEKSFQKIYETAVGKRA